MIRNLGLYEAGLYEAGLYEAIKRKGRRERRKGEEKAGPQAGRPTGRQAHITPHLKFTNVPVRRRTQLVRLTGQESRAGAGW